MADPVCPRLAALAAAAGREAGAVVVEGGAYIAIEGPQFSTRAESELYRSWGCDVIGMTNMPEAKLAREAELPYASVAMVTDYDCWHADAAHVDVAQIVAVPERQRRPGPRPGPAAGRAADRPAAGLADRHRARQRHHHRPRGPRSGGGRAAERRWPAGLWASMRVPP